MYRGVSYVLITYDLHHNFVRFLTVEKFNLPADFFTIQTLSTNDNSYPYIFQILFSQHV